MQNQHDTNFDAPDAHFDQFEVSPVAPRPKKLEIGRTKIA
jgi:hypothetical protein